MERFSSIILQAQAIRAQKLRLEALHKHVPAQKIYFGAGLKLKRELLFLEWKHENPVPVTVKEDMLLQAANMSDVVRHFQVFHPVAATWQRDLATIINQSNLWQLSYRVQGQLRGHILLTLRNETVHIMDAGAVGVDDLRYLLEYLQSRTLRV